MPDVIFDETVIYGAMGRNGAAHMGGLSVEGMGNDMVYLVPLNAKGDVINASMNLMAGDCGRIARAIAEAAATVSPRSRDEIAAQLRAALVTIESGADDRLDDAISSFEGIRGP